MFYKSLKLKAYSQHESDLLTCFTSKKFGWNFSKLPPQFKSFPDHFYSLNLNKALFDRTEYHVVTIIHCATCIYF